MGRNYFDYINRLAPAFFLSHPLWGENFLAAADEMDNLDPVAFTNDGMRPILAANDRFI